MRFGGLEGLKEPIKSVFCNQNAAFCGIQSVNKYSFHSFFSTSAPQWNILADVEGDGICIEERVHIAKWALDHIQLSQDVRGEIGRMIAECEKKRGSKS